MSQHDLGKRSYLREKIIQLRGVDGRSIRQTAKILGVSKNHVLKLSKENEESINSFRNMRLSLLAEKFYLTIEERAKIKAKIYLKAFKEFEKRDLSKMPTEKIIQLMVAMESGFSELMGSLDRSNSKGLEEIGVRPKSDDDGGLSLEAKIKIAKRFIEINEKKLTVEKVE